MNILIINTSTPDAYTAIVQDGAVAAEKAWPGDKTLGTALMIAIDDLLRECAILKSDLQRIAIHGGPGHYSALRSGVVTGTMLAMGLNIEMVQIEADTKKEIIRESMQNEPVKAIDPVYV